MFAATQTNVMSHVHVVAINMMLRLMIRRAMMLMPMMTVLLFTVLKVAMLVCGC